MMQSSAQQGWHTLDWGPWGWAETIVKGVAIFAGIAAFFASPAGAPLLIDGNPKLAAVILLALYALGYTGAIGFRYFQRETTSFLFSIPNALGHIGALIALLRAPDQTTLPLIFAAVYAAGQALKFIFHSTSGYTEGGLPKSAMVLGSALATAAYVVLALAIAA